MADNRRNLSDTAEINSILEEARARKNASAPKAPAGGRPSDSSRAVTRRPDAADGDYVYVDENGSYGTSSKGRKSGKSKKPLIITLVAVFLALALGTAAVIFFMNRDSVPAEDAKKVFAKDVTVSGISIGGMTREEAIAALKPVEDKLAANINIEVSAADKKYTLTKDDVRYSFDTADILAEATAYTDGTALDKKNAFDISLTVAPDSGEGFVEKIATEVDAEAKNAEVKTFNADKSDMFTFTAEENGRKLDSEKLLAELKGMFNSGKFSGSIEAEVKETKPEYTAEYLKKNIVKLSSFSTYSTNNSNGNNNMAVSLAACNSSIIEPGATWSFNKCTGDSNLESNGYLPAGVIIQGRYETGIGGGICQSSTTIYNAGILCGMEVVERYCHYYKSSYVDAGRDATIDYGNLDLKLKNPFKYQLFLKCYMDGVELHAEFYGLQSEDFDDVRITTSDPSYFSNGYRVTTTRTFYKDGKKVSSEQLPSSTYYTSAPDSGSSDSGSSNPKPTSSPDPTSADPDPGPDEPVEPDPGPDEPVEPDPGPDEPVEPDPGPDTPAEPEPVEGE